jgi:hypothetical protein
MDIYIEEMAWPAAGASAAEESLAMTGMTLASIGRIYNNNLLGRLGLGRIVRRGFGDRDIVGRSNRVVKFLNFFEVFLSLFHMNVPQANSSEDQVETGRKSEKKMRNEIQLRETNIHTQSIQQ